MPDGMVVANGAITYRRARTLAAQLAEIGVKPVDIAYVALSHTHGDHVGNIGLFPSSSVLIQGAEKKAQLWINHDKPQSATLRYAPAYYE
jgi:N-acyl homoserine lactone hydrolase